MDNLGILHFEALATGSACQSCIEANQLQRRRIMIGSDKGCGKLQAIGRPQRMCTQ
jgi:hypothetical protein